MSRPLLARAWVWALLGALVLGTVAWVAWPRGEESVDARTERIAAELRCVECEGLSVADAATSTARATRAEIRERVVAGDSDEEIRQGYVDRYGQWALMNPTGQGLDRLVWALPVVVVAVGATGIAVVVWRSRRTPRLAPTPADRALVATVAGDAPAGGGSAPGDEAGVLVEERDFLLRSLADLDAEHAAGNVDAETYATLHADYTARAAAAVRAVDADDVLGAQGSPPGTAPPVSWPRRVLVLAVIVTFATVAGAFLASAMGARLPGGLPSGDEAVIDAEEREARLRQAVADNPEDPGVHLALASFLVGRDDFAGALEAYDVAARLDPDDANAPAQAGWLLFVTAAATDDATQQAALLEGARTRLDAAVELAPDFPDARFFRGVVLLRGFGDAEAAVVDLQRALVLAPDGPLAEQVRVVLAEAAEAVEAGAGALEDGALEDGGAGRP